MKRLFLLLIVSMFLFSGCGILSVSLSTNINTGSNRVVITCPMKLGKVQIGKILLSKETRFTSGAEYVVVPGKITTVYTDGYFGDEPMTLTGFVYDKKENLVGRISAYFNFSEGDSRYPKLKQWNITENQIRWTEGDWFF